LRFVHACYGRGGRGEVCAEESPILSLRRATDFAGLLATCSSNHRQKVRQRLRRLTAQGEVTLWVAPPDATATATTEFCERFVPAYNARWNSHPAGNLLTRPGVTAFLMRVVREGVRDGWGHFVSLRVNGRPIAWHLGLYNRGALYWWVPTYDLAWEHFSPGNVLLAKLIEYGIAAQWSHIHLLTGGHRYKMTWCPDALDLRTIRWYAPSLRGQLIAWYDRYRQRRS
jgi:CelD/BcsL family acetyltransferase involved in cellulose biosynthesis